MIFRNSRPVVRVVLLCFLLFIARDAATQMIKQGNWRGSIQYDSREVPFTFELSYPNGEVPQLIIINGENRSVISNAYFEGDSLIIPLDPFDVEIRTTFSAMSMSGVYKKYYRDLTLPFQAQFGKPRIKKTSIALPVRIKDTWAITLSPNGNTSKAVGLFKQEGAKVSGTIMTEVGDYRFFEAILDGDSIKLSCFDGAHAFMFIGKLENGKWAGEMLYDNSWSEPWVATYDGEAELTDPFKMVKVEPETERPYFDLLGAGEGIDAVDPEKYLGKVTIIQLFGTWCPNSYDQTKYLVQWYEENKDRSVAILASSFEANYSQAYGLRRMEEYKAVNEIPYEVVLGCRLSKRSAAMPFEFMDELVAFPTLVILDKQGYARHVVSYFNGPATGSYYAAFDERFNQIIDELVAE